MTRFNISLQGGADLVIHAMEHAWGGEIFIRRFLLIKLQEVAKAIGPECKIDVIGIRPGEKNS